MRVIFIHDGAWWTGGRLNWNIFNAHWKKKGRIMFHFVIVYIFIENVRMRRRVSLVLPPLSHPKFQIILSFVVFFLLLLFLPHLFGEPEKTTTMFIRKGARNIRDSKACLLALWTCPFSTVSGNKSRQSVPGEISWTWQWCNDLILNKQTTNSSTSYV